jgi:16S rRNA (adenine(1408)-N(1))-methyltransferase
VDLGTGDGRLPWVLAQRAPDRFFIGVDANAAGLRDYSGRAHRAGMRNLIYVRAAVEALPAELTGVADDLTVVLPWGSLLAAVARPSVSALASVRRLCQPGAKLTVVLAVDAVRDHAELQRLGLPTLDAAHLAGELVPGYAEAGFAVTVETGIRDLSAWPSTWAGRLGHEGRRSVLQIAGRATA